MTLTPELVRALPKVLLHDHLDGGLRPQTVIDLAEAAGHTLPATDADELAQWFTGAAGSGSLELYLRTFEHTVAVMQTPQALRRVAREAVIDLAADGVVYAEQRYAPEQHQRGDLSLEAVVEAVQAGFAEGVAAAAAQGNRIEIGTLITAMRHADRASEIAELALAYRDAGVVGFDIAGAEAGFPPSRHADAFTRLRHASFPVTIHAGESDGIESIREAVHLGGALRLGHGVRIDEEISLGHDEDGEPIADLGLLAQWVLDRQLPLEMCPTSNVQTGAATSVAEHPITLLRDLGFAVTINTDNRLMSGTTMSREISRLVDEAGWTLADVEAATLTAAWNGFAHLDVLAEIVETQILPAFAALDALDVEHTRGHDGAHA